MDPLALVPHRPPFLLIDRLVRWDDAGAEGELVVRDALPLSPAGTLSPFLAAEALAQTAAAHAGALAAAAAPAGPPHRGVVVRLDAFEAPRPARAGERLTLHVTLERAFGPLRRYRAEARAGDELVARGTFTFATDPVPPAPAAPPAPSAP